LLGSVWWFDADISGPPIGPKFNGQTFWTAWPLKMVAIDSAETSVSNYLSGAVTQKENFISTAAEA
jgi:hypothetical protein